MKIDLRKIDIPSILEVAAGNLDRVGDFLAKKNFKKVVLLYGENIKNMFGTRIEASLTNNLIEILKTYETDNNNFKWISENAFDIPNETAVIIGIGGGKSVDIAKYIAFLNDIPLISIPTSCSNDGFASAGCSLMINGKRTSVSARIPYGIIVDTTAIKDAPVKFLYSGIGDIVSKITAIYDWFFEEKNGIGQVNDFAVMIAKKSVNSIVRMENIDLKNDWFIKEVVDSLTMSGISMEIAGNSAPASGSEHLISHALDKIVEKPQLHGIQVGIATYIMSMVQNHRVDRIRKFLTETGFFENAELLGMKAKDFENAIKIAHEIKPNRFTFLHLKENRDMAIKFLYEDEILKKVLKYDE